MDTLDDYLNGSHDEQDAERAKRGWAPRPPIVHTHRKPVIITAQMIFEHRARLAARTTPNTHRGEPRPVMEELRFNTANAGRAHA